MRFAIKFAYDGRKFHGFARQPGLKTIEDEIIKALIKNGFIEDTVESCFRYASRTDKGVSALSNVVAFNTDSSIENVFQVLNEDLAEIIFYGVKNVDQEFFPRYAKLRFYRYYLKSDGINFDKLLSAASIFVGEHDFSNFARVEEFKDPVRAIDNIIISEEDGFFLIDFFAQTFLWNQIRRIVSPLEKVGSDKLLKEHVIAALDNPDKKVDFGLAPAEPLVLKDIIYDFEFEYDNSRLKELDDFEKRILGSISL
jgi:tRNA pseudouridine38-40 synthase